MEAFLKTLGDDTELTDEYQQKPVKEAQERPRENEWSTTLVHVMLAMGLVIEIAQDFPIIYNLLHLNFISIEWAKVFYFQVEQML